MNLKEMGITLDHATMFAKLDVAMRAMVRTVVEHERFAAGAMFGGAAAWLLECGVTREQMHDFVDAWFEQNGDLVAQLKRLEMRVVPQPESDDDIPPFV